MGVRRVKGSRPPPHHHHNDKRHHATLPRDPIGGGGVDGIAVVVLVWRGWTDEGTQGFRVADGAPWFMGVDRKGRWKVEWRDGYGVGRWKGRQANIQCVRSCRALGEVVASSL